MSNPMTMTELGDLLKHISTEHSPFSPRKGRTVKYVDPHIDMRDFKCFAVTLRGFSYEQVFHTQNECANLSQSLQERIMEWLDTKECVDVL